ncbi:MAG: nickel pincer cofactor biosynthesis protein LarB [Deltaproteobacteria bacterium]|nr:nickel pincer cofactor biosynthesis protein LarB [Deltaproteobacteria bacterium]
MPGASDPSDGELPFATVDLDRHARTGFPEVVYGEGKSAEQVAAVLGLLRARGQVGLATRVSPEKGRAVVSTLGEGARYDDEARAVIVGEPGPGVGRIGVVSAGTSDGAVAAEAVLVARVLGNHVERFVDVGVAGVHRVLRRVDELRRCNALVVVAGMDGALPSVVGGLVRVPVIAVPTSVGYGASFGGVAALLSMLNSCAPGVVVVNIDNGFGAAFAASRINRAVALREEPA